MVYRKYIEREGKRFGPYYFKSIRDKNGKVKSVYLGTKDPSRKKLPFIGVFFLVALLFVFGFLGLFAYQGFQVLDVSEVLESEEVDVFEEERGEVEIDSEIIEEELDEPVLIEEGAVEEVVISNEGVPEEGDIGGVEVEEDIVEETETNETELVEEDIEINETEEVELEDNGTIEIFPDLEESPGEDFNETEINNTLPLNETISDVNLTIEVNQTNGSSNLNETEIIIIDEFNQTVVNYTIGGYTNITTSYYDVAINQPVRWQKRIDLGEEVQEIEIELPLKASNITVTKIQSDELKEGDQKLSKVNQEEIKKPNLITGNVVGEFQIKSFFRNFFSNLFTGLAVFEERKGEQKMVIEGPLSGLIIEYYMPGPVAKEQYISKYKKKIVISGDIDYENILVHSDLNDIPMNKVGSVNLYNSNKEKQNFEAYGTKNHPYVDYILWTVPKVNQSYDIEVGYVLETEYLRPHPETFEWWYLSGKLTDTKNQDYYYMVSFFNDGLRIKQLILPNGSYYYSSENVEYVMGNFSLAYGGDKLFESNERVLDLNFEIEGHSLDLSLVAMEDALPINKIGKIYWYGSSEYYSYPYLFTEGTIFMEKEPLVVKGVSWLEHQFGEIDSKKIVEAGNGWEWFSLHLDNGLDIRANYLYENDSLVLKTLNIINNSQIEVISDFDIINQGYSSLDSGNIYSNKWRISAENLELEVSPIYGNTEIVRRNSFWEGPISAKGKFYNSPVNGWGFAELIKKYGPMESEK